MPERLLSLLATLRHPQNGCPWDRKQTPLSLCPGILDEAYELVEAIEQGGSPEVAEELGDLLFQLMFVVYLHAENEQFDLNHVVTGIEAKMVRRHPHVFGDEHLPSTGQVLERWEQIKLGEKKGKHPLDSIPKIMPALAHTRRLCSKAQRLGWMDNEGTHDLQALLSEVMRDKQPQAFAQLLFSLVQWGMVHNLNAEDLLRAANSRFTEKIKAGHPVEE